MGVPCNKNDLEIKIIMIYNWGVVKQTKIWKKIYNNWTELIADTNTKETDCHNFIKKYPNLFFPRYNNAHNHVISKLKFGSDYELDFLNCYSERSAGFKYQFFELESPHTPPFTKKGIPSSRLSGAIQQINDWKRWISGNMPEAKKVFPSSYFDATDVPNFQYFIIIGNKENSKNHIGKRNQLSQELGINIRSFDFFTDSFSSKNLFAFSKITKQLGSASKNNNNYLNNPFILSFGSSDWNSIVKNDQFKKHHMTGEKIELFKEYIRIKEDDFISFKKEYKLFSEDEIKLTALDDMMVKWS
jgi:hypothetical protein